MERPMATLGFSFFLSLILASFLELKMTVVLAALCFVAFVAGLFIRSLRNNRQVMTVLLAAMAAFSMYAGQEMLTYRPLQKWDGRTARLRVETIDWVQKDAGQNVKVRVLDGQLPKGTYLTLWISGSELYPTPYDILEGEFRLSTPKDSRDGKIRGYSKSQKTYLNAYSSAYGEQNIKLTSPSSRPWMYTILRARRSAHMWVMSQPKMSDVAGLMEGIAFGFRDNISSEIKTNFRIMGVSHLLAVSGLQTALLAQALLALLLFCRVPRRASSAVAMGGVLFFMALTGFSSSVMRAGVMSMVFLIGMMVGREPDGLNSLGIAVFAIAVVNPYAINDVGLLLSFAATFGLLALLKPIQQATSERLRKCGGKVCFLARPVDAIAITVAATIPTLPVILFSFGQISLMSPLSNLLMVFPSTIVTVATGLGALFAAVPPLRFVATAVFWIGKWVARYLVAVATWLASLPMASIWTRQTFLLLCVPAAILLVLLGRRWLGQYGMRVAALWSVIALLCGMLSYGTLMHGVTRIQVLSADNATAIVLERGKHIGVIMMGEDKAVTASTSYLRRLNVRTVDFLMIPGLGDECAYSPMTLTDEIGVNCLITGPQGEYSDTVDALPASGRLCWDSGDIAFWNDCRAELDDGWLLITIGLTRLLVCPFGGNAAELTPPRRLTNLAVFTGTPPLHVSSITAQAGVLSCSIDSLSSAIKAIPQGAYPLRTTVDDDITLLTRGQGDLAFR